MLFVCAHEICAGGFQFNVAQVEQQWTQHVELSGSQAAGEGGEDVAFVEGTDPPSDGEGYPSDHGYKDNNGNQGMMQAELLTNSPCCIILPRVRYHCLQLL